MRVVTKMKWLIHTADGTMLKRFVSGHSLS